MHRWGRPPQELLELPERLIDPDVAVIRLDGVGGSVGALMVYASHPTASSEGIPTIVSSDFPGHGRAVLEREFGHPFVFLQRCAGNVGTGKWVAGTPWEDTVAMGARFATGVAAGLAVARPVDAASVSVATSEIPLDLDPFPPIAEMERQLEEAARIGAFAGIVAIGDALVVARWLEERRRARITALSLGPSGSVDDGPV